jgi:hypothetical protein
MTPTKILCAAALLCGQLIFSSSVNARDVVAFWGFADHPDFTMSPNKQEYDADVDATVAGNAYLQAYLGVADELDNNGGAGFVSYTSPTSGISYGPTRDLKFDDIRGGGNNFDIGGVTTFQVDKNDGAGPLAENFGNDALLYFTFDGSGYQDFEIRFDVEGTPGELPPSFDIFFRTGGTGGIWYRLLSQNNIPLSFVDYLPADPENQYADSGVIALSPILNGASIELIINDFVAGDGNGQMELDNIEITANLTVPEPASLMLLGLGLMAAAGRRRVSLPRQARVSNSVGSSLNA